MGFMKDNNIDEISRGYYSCDDKNVCHNCIPEENIKDIILNEGSVGECDYCQTSNNKTIKLVRLLEIIVSGIKSEWGNPLEEGAVLDIENGGYHSVDTYDTNELLMEILNDDYFKINDQLLKDIVDNIENNAWCIKYPYEIPDDEYFYYNWERFANMVKHEMRHVFLKVNNISKSGISDDSDSVSKILSDIGEMINEMDLVNEYPIDTKFYRARKNKEGEIYDNCEKLGPPKIEKCKQPNRMSPAGIPMFYGAMDETTALEEILPDKVIDLDFVATIASFKSIETLLILDLTNLPPIPSLFDSEKRENRNKIKFLMEFAHQVSQPIKKDGVELIEYVPTQIFTEFIRHVYRYGDKMIDGILYESSRNENGKSCVLFVDNKNCIDEDALAKIKQKRLTNNSNELSDIFNDSVFNENKFKLKLIKSSIKNKYIQVNHTWNDN